MQRALVVILALSVLASCTPDAADPGPLDAAIGPDVSSVCAGDEDCDDDRFCNGVERCDGRRCEPGTPPACGTGTCDEASDMCRSDCADADGDGFPAASCGGSDCDDTDERRYPGNIEICDAMGLDEDCDPATLGSDRDSDGFVGSSCCNRLPAGRLECGDDCDDDDDAISPAQIDPCGGGDQDCDGMVDENPDQTFYRDLDGDGHGIETDTLVGCSAPPGYAVLAGDCDDTRSGVNPGVPERCNLIDDNCIDGIDEGCDCAPEGASETCGPPTDVGSCQFGSRTCVAGVWSMCSGAIYPSPEVCDGSFDENCSGTVDEGCECTSGSTRLCGMSIGVCRAALQTCGEGRWPRACDDEPGVISPGVEVCDGLLDEDCDGAVDEGCECTHGAIDRSACGTEVGECASGLRTCTAGMWGTCSGGVGPSAEVCDGARDEDCDAAVDEGCACVDGTTRSCGAGACAGTQTCSSGAWGVCSGADPSAEICNGIDDDCDGLPDATDTGVAMVGSSCGTTTGLCTVGTYSCPGSSLACSGAPPATEVCDHRDQDCDGLLDESVGLPSCSITRTASGSPNLQAIMSCSWGACTGTSGRIDFATTSPDPARIAVLPVVPGGSAVDWGEYMSVEARFELALRTPSSSPDGWFGAIITPTTSLGASSPGFPVLSGNQRAFAALVRVTSTTLAMQLWEITPSGSFMRRISFAAAACRVDSTTRAEYRIRSRAPRARSARASRASSPGAARSCSRTRAPPGSHSSTVTVRPSRIRAIRSRRSATTMAA